MTAFPQARSGDSFPDADPCPCGTGLRYGSCCGRYHHGHAVAPTAVTLMRSRYTAFVLRNEQYLLATWDPATRPEELNLHPDSGPDIEFFRLDIIDTVGGRLGDSTGVVEFEAWYRSSSSPSQQGRQHERSSFYRADGKWFYHTAQ